MGFFNDIGKTLFHSNQAPYDAASDKYSDFMGQATNAQRPYSEFGQRAIPKYEDWLSQFMNPNAYMDKAFESYRASPDLQRNQRASQNAASATGLTGSTPLAHELARTAGGDMQSWLQNILGISQQYGQGLQSQLGMGQNATNMLSNLWQNQAGGEADLAFGRQKARMADMANTLGMIGGFGQGFGQGWNHGLSGQGMNFSALTKMIGGL